MKSKKLEQDSRFEDYDFDNDGVVTDQEIERAKEIREFEDQSRKHLGQLRIARWTLIGMGAFTAGMFAMPIEKIEALSDISNLFYISGAGIVGAFMGAQAWMNKK
jgi:hypothetical protein